MSGDDQTAIDLYEDLSRPVVKDLQLTPMVFDLARLRCTSEGARHLFERLALIHDAVRPRGPGADNPESE